jgi:hypothetical protein
VSIRRNGLCIALFKSPHVEGSKYRAGDGAIGTKVIVETGGESFGILRFLLQIIKKTTAAIAKEVNNLWMSALPMPH